MLITSWDGVTYHSQASQPHAISHQFPLEASPLPSLVTGPYFPSSTAVTWVKRSKGRNPSSGQILFLFLMVSHQRMGSQSRVGSGGMASAPPVVLRDAQDTVIVQIAPNHHDTLLWYLLVLLQGWQPHSIKRDVDAWLSSSATTLSQAAHSDLFQCRQWGAGWCQPFDSPGSSQCYGWPLLGQILEP